MLEQQRAATTLRWHLPANLKSFSAESVQPGQVLITLDALWFGCIRRRRGEGEREREREREREKERGRREEKAIEREREKGGREERQSVREGTCFSPKTQCVKLSEILACHAHMLVKLLSFSAAARSSCIAHDDDTPPHFFQLVSLRRFGLFHYLTQHNACLCRFGAHQQSRLTGT